MGLRPEKVSMADAHVSIAGQLPLTNFFALESATLAIDSEARALCVGLTEEQLSFSMRPGSWSIAQNLAHLRVTAEVFLPKIDFVLDQTRTQKLIRPGLSALGPYGRLMVWQMNSRWMFRLKAPQALQPRLLPSPCLELEQFLLSQAAMRKRIQQAEGLNLTAMRFSSPVAKFVRMNLLECFSVLVAHSRRHLRQANKVRRAL
jgi:hypothetical protein